MTEQAPGRPMLVNLKSQPLEIHRAVDVLVLPPRGRAELREGDRALPQLQALLAGRHVAILDAPEPGLQAAAPEAGEPAPGTTQPARASPAAARPTRSAPVARRAAAADKPQHS